MATAIADDKTPQRKILADILAERSLGLAVQPVLNLLPGFKRDERLMLAGRKRDIPVRRFQIAGIDDALQKLPDALEMHFALAIFRIGRAVIQIAFDLDQRFQLPAGIAFQHIGNDGGKRLITHQHLAVAANGLIAVALRRGKGIVAIHKPGAHAVFDLLGVLLALMLGNGGQEVLNKLAVGILAKLDGRTFQPAACITDGGAKLNMGLKPTRKTADIIDNDDVLF